MHLLFNSVFCVQTSVVHLLFNFVFCALCSPDWGEHMYVPDPMDVDGGAEVEVSLNGRGHLGQEWHPVFLVSATNLQSSLFLFNLG